MRDVRLTVADTSHVLMAVAATFLTVAATSAWRLGRPPRGHRRPAHDDAAVPLPHPRRHSTPRRQRLRFARPRPGPRQQGPIGSRRPARTTATSPVKADPSPTCATTYVTATPPAATAPRRRRTHGSSARRHHLSPADQPVAQHQARPAQRPSLRHFDRRRGAPSRRSTRRGLAPPWIATGGCRAAGPSSPV